MGAYFVQRETFQIHPFCCTHWQFIPFHCWIVLHSLIITACLFICLLTDIGVVSRLGLFWIRPLWTVWSKFFLFRKISFETGCQKSVWSKAEIIAAPRVRCAFLKGKKGLESSHFIHNKGKERLLLHPPMQQYKNAGRQVGTVLKN